MTTHQQSGHQRTACGAAFDWRNVTLRSENVTCQGCHAVAVRDELRIQLDEVRDLLTAKRRITNELRRELAAAYRRIDTRADENASRSR
jgi:hypothetical protein